MQEPKPRQVPIPTLLSKLPDAPKQLFVRGELDKLLARPRVAIVGSRKMSPYGQMVTDKIARELANRGVVIVSGLAFGVDIQAHKSALETGGQGIAVMACGLDQIYPVSHARIGERLLETGGAIVSEYPKGTAVQKHYFLERNRLVSGLSDAIIITEAAARSGTLNTAAHALNQGKPVFAVPGNLNNPLSEGTNGLIKAGALMLTSVEDVLATLSIALGSTKAVPPAANQQEYIILQLLSQGLSDASEVLKQSELEADVFNQTLTMLEITAKIRPLGANCWALA